jgi:hypothetical protein
MKIRGMEEERDKGKGVEDEGSKGEEGGEDIEGKKGWEGKGNRKEMKGGG